MLTELPVIPFAAVQKVVVLMKHSTVEKEMDGTVLLENVLCSRVEAMIVL